ncbi:MAG TPA: hypothetical protein VIE65_18115 [Methylobacter sp.]
MTGFRKIASIANVIEHLDPEPYSFNGHCWLESKPEARTSIEFECEFMYDAQALVADWPRSTYELRIPFQSCTFQGAIGELFIRGFGQVSGQIIFADGHVLFGGSNEIVKLFAHVCFEENNIVSLAGTYELNGNRHLFSIRGGKNPGSASIANLQSNSKFLS